MKNKTYSESLKDPRWQKKRLKLLEAANWECSACGCKEDTLEIHHTYYAFGVPIWDHEDQFLRVVCSSCHKQHQEMMNHAYRVIGLVPSAVMSISTLADNTSDMEAAESIREMLKVIYNVTVNTRIKQEK
jgi:formyltetrahydrofolate synthetase